MSRSRRSPFLFELYRRYLDHHDSAEFARAVSQVYSQGSLERLAEHDSPQVRRAAVLALGFLGDYQANQTLGRLLQDEDRTVRMLSENSIRNVWTRAGSEEDRRELNVLIRLNAAQHYHDVIRRAGNLLERAPWFAEVWNQRALAHFALGRYDDSVRDCHQALEINPYHFGAAAGMGQAYLKLGNQASALESFRRALRLNPDLEAVRVQVARLTRLIEDTGSA